LGLGEIPSSLLYIGFGIPYISTGTWKNSKLSPLYKLWDLEKFRALTTSLLYIGFGTMKNFELFLSIEAIPSFPPL